MVYNIGGTVPLSIEVRDAADALTNASTNVLTITLPDGSTAVQTTTNPSTGIYSCLYVPVQAGRHAVDWLTTTPATRYTDTFDVSETAAPLIVSLSEAKDYLNIDDTDQDDELRGFIEGVTAVVEGGDGRDFPGVGPVVRRTTTTVVRGGGCGYPLPYAGTNIISLTSGAYLSDASVVDLTGYTFDQGILRPPYSGTLPTTPWTLTYVVGIPSLPANIRMGALEILELAWNSQRGNGEAPTFLIPYRAQAWLGSYTQALGFA